MAYDDFYVRRFKERDLAEMSPANTKLTKQYVMTVRLTKCDNRRFQWDYSTRVARLTSLT